MTKNLTQLIKKRILDEAPGWCFTYANFANLGNYDAIRKVLSRLTNTRFIIRLASGLFYYPRHHNELGEIPVLITAVIDALQRSEHIKCQPSGAYAANLLGLSEQVPATITILTDGPTKKIKIGNREIIFKKTVPKNMATVGTITGLIIQAIKFIGKDHITSEHLQRLKQRLTANDINTLKRNAYLAPEWIAKLIKSELIGE